MHLPFSLLRTPPPSTFSSFLLSISTTVPSYLSSLSCFFSFLLSLSHLFSRLFPTFLSFLFNPSLVPVLYPTTDLVESLSSLRSSSYKQHTLIYLLTTHEERESAVYTVLRTRRTSYLGVLLPYFIPEPRSTGWPDWDPTPATYTTGGLCIRMSRSTTRLGSSLDNAQCIFYLVDRLLQLAS